MENTVEDAWKAHDAALSKTALPKTAAERKRDAEPASGAVFLGVGGVAAWLAILAVQTACAGAARVPGRRSPGGPDVLDRESS